MHSGLPMVARGCPGFSTRNAPPRSFRRGHVSVVLAGGSFPSTTAATLTSPWRTFFIPLIEPLTNRGAAPTFDSAASTASAARPDCSPRPSTVYVRVHGTDPRNARAGSTTAAAAAAAAPAAASDIGGASQSNGGSFRFAMKDAHRGLLDHGVSPAAADFIAQAEAEYRATTDHLHQPPGGPALLEAQVTRDSVTGAVSRRTRIAAPLAGDETYVPSSKARHTVRGTVGELGYQAAVRAKFLLDERAQLSLRKERQLGELLASPMALVAKAEEAAWLLRDAIYPQGLTLQPRTAENVMTVFGQSSMRLRLDSAQPGGKSPMLGAATATTVTLSSIPFLDEMRRLYSHQKAAFTAPTALTVEHMMIALSAVTGPNAATFQLANRLLLDCDRFVVLPTRTTYAAYFTVCRVNDAVVPFAVARLRDAVVSLQVSIDAPMATELLRGLNETGYVEEAVALLARIKHVPMTTPLLNACLETLLLSRQPDACFAAYASVQQASLKPSADTFTLLLLACEQGGNWSRVTMVLADMQRRRVRGNAQTLNLLLKGLLTQGLSAYAAQLHATMQVKGVEVWPALAEGVHRLRRKVT